MKNNFNVGEVLFELYLDDTRLNDPGLASYEESLVFKKFIDYVKNDKDLRIFSIRTSEKNFGHAASWVLIAVDFLANNDVINAISNIGGLLPFAVVFRRWLGKLKETTDKYIKIGIRSAFLIALGELVEHEKEEFEYELISESEDIETNCGFESKKYNFEFKVTIKNKCFNYYITIDWNGKVVSIKKTSNE